MNPFEIKIPAERLRVLIILGLSLPAGTLMFALIIAGVVKPPGPPFNFSIETFEMVFLAQILFVVPAAFIVPPIILRKTADQTFSGINLEAELEQESLKDAPPKQTERYLNIYTTQMIIGLALLEGVAIFGVVVYLMNQSMIGLIGAGVLILLMFTKFPTLSHIQNTLADIARNQQIAGDRKI